MKTQLSALSCTLLVAGLMAFSSTCSAQDFVTNRAGAEVLVSGLNYQHGRINLQDGLATIEVPTNFNYLGREDAEKVLVKLWRNPPSSDTLGMLIPADKGPLDPDCWAVTLSYANDGYVKDTDANKINYDDLLKQMQKDVQAANKERAQRGYSTFELVGWAAPPRYDADTHKLYWAKDLKFDGESSDTLNYNIRILGRRGVLVLDVIGGMDQLDEVQKETPQILSMVNFDQGNRYADFDPKIDKVAAYGIAALVAGGVAAKLGLFKLLWVFILGAKKFIIIAFAALAAWFRKIFKRGGNPGT
jgi:uncharacterized membrane-anchored protein